MRTRRAVAVVGAVLVTLLCCATPGVATAAPCPGATAPGPPVDESEAPRPGQAEPAPLPVPDPPVGGDAMGTCGTVVGEGAPPPPNVGVVSYVLADLDSGQVLAARDPHARLRPASLMKTLTGLLVARNLPMDETLVGTPEDANQEGTRVGIGPGGRYTVDQLLHAMLMASGNDAAYALAVRLTGSAEGTVALMNKTAHDLGALDTRAATPSGLDGPGMQTSAYDLASIFRVGMREPPFAAATGTRQIPFPGYGTTPGTFVDNDNKLITRYPGAIGGKTGFTDDARHTYIGAAQRNGRRLVVVLMRGEQRPVPMFEQGIALLDYGFAQPTERPVGQLTDAAPGASEPSTAPAGDSAGLGPIDGDDGGSGSWTTPVIIGGLVLIGLLLVGVRMRDRPGAGGRRRRR